MAMPGGGAWGASVSRAGDPDEDLEGYRLLASTRAGNVPTIVVSGVATAEDIDRAYAEHGVFACLAKQTFQRKAFLQTLREARAVAQAGSELDVLTAREREVLQRSRERDKARRSNAVIVADENQRHLGPPPAQKNQGVHC